MEEGEKPEASWTGTARAKITGSSPDQAWTLLGNFCGLHMWVPAIHTCHRLEGVESQPGCVRYCAGSVNRADSTQTVGWSKERLVAFDPAQRAYSYEVVETNKGFGRYVATLRVVPDPAGGGGEGCALEWSFESDPVKGWTQEGFVFYLEKLARGVAERVAEAVRAGN